ncbi:sister chromatid cohesion protein PDS5 homolog C-like isoform X1 [Rhododendron vialii]|uniref:sister chromatid cohesion protein PDS5 homolog C-like isoform X1 n=1 Tax=Rhododendron vialii TaxID=182163 RepID=UPI00265E4054|nr:sister chromatid cohesion protein PDS5 homolog C-like isoform X1 [Rhododendron vialii]XP_058203522.1 sister chromatid cohesion protein PDS5 homolog C-like isoform X1 [Rhododendron vialii]
MACTDTGELERQLEEAGNKLLQLPPSVDEILSLLDQVENYLSRVEQSPSKSMQTALSPSRKALVADELLRHQDVDVKVAVASCISEITRITAPDAPYDDDQMKDIFQLIVSSFENLSDKSSRSYDRRTLILETVAKVRSCVVMLDLECDGLIVEMFQHFLKAIRDDHPDNVFSSMETIMTLVLEESEDISLELISPILASLKSENQGVPAIARKLAERVVENSAIKLKPCLIQAMKSLRLSLDDYNKVITSICNETTDADGRNDRNTCGEQSTEDSNLARTSSDLAVQDENKLVMASPEESAQDQLTKESVPETRPEGDHPVEDRSPKSVMSNGVAEAGCVDRMEDHESSKEREQEQAHQTDQSVDTTVTSNGEPDESNSGKITKSDTKAEETSKKRARKPKSVINSTDPHDSSRVDGDKEAESTAHHESSLSKEVHTSPSGEPSVEVLVPPADEKENIQMSSSKETGSEAMDVASPSSSGNVPVEGRSEKVGRAKKNDKMIREVAPSADVSKEASDGTFVSEGKQQRRSGKKATAGRTTEERTPDLADKLKSEGGTTSDSEDKPLKLCVRMDRSSLKNKKDGKKQGRGKAILKKSSAQDDDKEMIPSPKPVLNLDKKVEEDTPKTSSKKKRTPAKDKVEEDAPKTSSKRKRTPVEEKVEEETPNTSSKKKRTPAKEKASDTVVYGRNLVDSKVKVWWPDDEKFYEGVIVSYDSVKKKHKVSYTDGDKEVLNLRQEKWEFVGDDSMSDAEQADECRSPDPSHEMQKKKRAKTKSEPSTKQVKMEGSRGGGASSSKSKGADAKSDSKSRVDAKVSDNKSGDKTEDARDGKFEDLSKKARRKSNADGSTADGKSKVDGGTPKTSLKPKSGTRKTDAEDTPKTTAPKTASKSKGKETISGKKFKDGSSKVEETEGKEEETPEKASKSKGNASRSGNKSKANGSGKVKETERKEDESPETIAEGMSSKVKNTGSKSGKKRRRGGAKR